MFVSHLYIWWHLLQTNFLCMFASWSKWTSFRWIQHIDRCSLDRNQTLIFFCIYTRHRTKQSHCVWMSRIIENIIYRSLLYHLTCIHNGYFITNFCYNT